MQKKIKHDIPDVDKSIGRNIAEIRKQKGYTQVELSKQLGITQQLLSHYEIGRLHLSAEMVIKIAENLSVSTDEILATNDNNYKLSLRFARRMKELESLPESKKRAVLQVLDDLIRANS